MAQTLYHYAGCSTCRKARKWLSQQGQSPVLIPLAAEPPSPERLRALWQASGLPLKKFFNTSGQSYRGGDFKNRLPKMSDDEQLEALAADGMLIKRPILDLGARVLVGFREAEWAEALGV